MGAAALTIASALQCPHGGAVQITTSNARVTGAAPLAVATDTFTVVGCPFQIPATPPIPSPCVTVQWLLTDLRTRVGPGATLSQSSAGICLSAAQVPQGPVTISATDARVRTQ